MFYKKSTEIKNLALFLTPALIFYVLFMVIPVVLGLSYSFTDWNGMNPNFKFVGLNNFNEAITKDKNFLNSIGFTIKYVVVMVVLSNVLALFLAVLIDSRIKTQNLFRTLYFIPNMISFIIGAYIWQFIFKKVLKELAKLPLLGFLSQPWLGDPKFSFWAIVMMSLWTSVGYLLVIYIAALQGVPTEIKEAARVDGARGIQVFRYVTLPMIMHAVTINLFLMLNNSFKAFDQIYGLTGGGPGRTTQVMSLNIYSEAFSNYFRFGYANAKAIILFLFVLVVTLVQLKLTGNKEVKS
jgi:raffinose/stachyose/melibiose transport system permease protein